MCQLHEKPKRGDFLYTYVTNIFKNYGNFTSCPWLPGVYKIEEFVVDSNAIPTYLELPNKNVTLSFSHYKKQKVAGKVVVHKPFINVDFRFRYIN